MNAELQKRWATFTATLAVPLVDKINEYDDDDPPEEMSFLLKHPPMASSDTITMSGTW